jgi:hypothetical protein
VIPHPEQFWPILLADYDIDGIEVWNPQSREYTEFLINVVNRRKQGRPLRAAAAHHDGRRYALRRESARPRIPGRARRPAASSGYQPAWDDVGIRKNLAVAGMDRGRVIDEYKQRLGG